MHIHKDKAHLARSQMSHIAQLQQQIMLMPPCYNTAVSGSPEPRASGVVSTTVEQATRPSECDLENYSKQKRRPHRRRSTSTFSLIFGVLYVSRINFGSTQENGRNDQEANDQEAQEFIFRPYANRYFSRGFSLLRERSFGAWNIFLRSYATFSTDDPVYSCCAAGDLLGMQRLLSDGKASPFAVTHQGYTLLHVCSESDRG